MEMIIMKIWYSFFMLLLAHQLSLGCLQQRSIATQITTEFEAYKDMLTLFNTQISANTAFPFPTSSLGQEYLRFKRDMPSNTNEPCTKKLHDNFLLLQPALKSLFAHITTAIFLQRSTEQCIKEYNQVFLEDSNELGLWLSSEQQELTHPFNQDSIYYLSLLTKFKEKIRPTLYTLQRDNPQDFDKRSIDLFALSLTKQTDQHIQCFKGDQIA
jgi:hypothetical protein